MSNVKERADSYDVGSYAAHLALSSWGIGWNQLSIATRKAVLTYHVTEILRGKIWADDAMPRQDPENWGIEDVFKIVKSFTHVGDRGLDFEDVKQRAVQKRPRKGSTVECTEELLGL